MSTVRDILQLADELKALDQRPFVHYVDLHYQVDRFGTKNKAPNFYE